MNPIDWPNHADSLYHLPHHNWWSMRVLVLVGDSSTCDLSGLSIASLSDDYDDYEHWGRVSIVGLQLGGCCGGENHIW